MLKRILSAVSLLLLPTTTSFSAIENEEDSGSRTDREYHFGIGAAKITSIGNGYDHYQKLFGNPSIYPEFWADYSFWAGWGFDVGVGLRLGAYKDSGHSATRFGGIVVGEDGLEQDLPDGAVDTSQTSQLSLLPIQGVVTLGYSPFASRWVVANVWTGVGLTYVENTTKANVGDNVDSGDIETYINSGWNNESVFGASISFDLTSLDAWDAYSMSVHGVDGIFITPFFQTVKTVKKIRLVSTTAI